MFNFQLQYTLTLLTFLLIPLMLWAGKRRNLRRTTLVIFLLLAVANLIAWYLSHYFATYLYLAIIPTLSMFLVKRNNPQ